MIAAFQPSSAERPADPLSALGRNASPAPQAGPRFADLLQRGQATHGVLAKPAPATPTPPAQHAANLPLPPPDAGVEAPTRPVQPPGLRPTLAKAVARPVTPPHEQAATVAPPMTTTPAEGSSQATTELVTYEPNPALHQTDGQTVTAAAPTSLVDWLTGVKAPDGTTVRPDVEDTTLGMPGADRRGPHFDSAPGSHSPVDLRTDDARQPDPAQKTTTAQASADAIELPAPAAAVTAAADMRPVRTEARLASDLLAGPFAGVVGALPRGADQLAPAAITVAVPVDSPMFPQALGAQVSVLARDGVQRAELHLNPVELGPISVQIEIVGQEARVDFGASLLTTCNVIERGLPELASALREQGFTLAGGGVSQHAPEPRRPPAGDATRGSRKAAAGEIAPARTFMQRGPEGMLDLYA